MDAPEGAREYSRLKDRVALFGMALSVLSTGAFVFSGFAGRVNRRLLPEERAPLIRRLRYTAVLSLLASLVELPLSFFSGYIIEKRYGLSKQTVVSWSRDVTKAKGMSLPIELAIVEGLYTAIRRWPARWWVVCAGAVVPLTAVFAHLFPILIAPRFNRYEPLRDRELATRLRNLTGRAGVSIAGVMQMDMSRRTTKANAFFAGVGSTKRIVLADTLLDRFTPEEIEGVVAHETAHQVHRDIWRFIGLSGVFTLVTAWIVNGAARRLLLSQPRLVGTSDLASPRSLPMIGLVLSIVGLVLTPLQLAISRQIERRSDRYAIDLTGNPLAYAGAMRKLADTNLVDPNPPRAVALLLHSHPPIAERVAAAEQAARDRSNGAS